VPEPELWEVFNMGCGFVAVVPKDRAPDAAGVLERHHRGTAVIGKVTAEGGRVAVPSRGIAGDLAGLQGI
jgi:phosphoribosylformylglycinamidine cyclo-ligase